MDSTTEGATYTLAKIRFHYAVENQTDSDYEFPSKSNLLESLKWKLGDLSSSIESAHFSYPTFIPAKASVIVSVEIYDPVNSKETCEPALSSPAQEKECTEKLRAHLEQAFPQFDGFVIYDKLNHYQIDFPIPSQ